MNQKMFQHLVLLIGTNPLPNFVVADFFLQKNSHIKKIWLIHSEENVLQAGTNRQASNLEELLRTRWKKEKQHAALQFPLEKISLSDVSNAKRIRSDLQKMCHKLDNIQSIHLNYTGSTKSMSIHVYAALKEADPDGQNTSYSYLDARNFRLVDDEQEVLIDDLRKEVQLTFAELIKLHGFKRCNKDRATDFSQSSAIIEERINNRKGLKSVGGNIFEDYIAGKIEQALKNRCNNQQSVLQHWQIQQPDWGTNNFELDVILLHGYQLTGISCTINDNKRECKTKGFEIILRTRQIGGDEAKAILSTGMKSNDTRAVQKELMYDTGGNKKNILVLGRDDLKNDLFIRKIEQFIFG